MILPLRITKKDDVPRRQMAAVLVVSIGLALFFSGVVMLFFGLNPIQVFGTIVQGAFGTAMRLEQTMIKAVPLTIASLGILVAFKMKFWNIGGEGQIMMGAFAASWVALYHQGLPAGAMLPLMALASIAAGGVWALIPAIFKAKMGTNETIFTLMMNYIAIKFVMYLQYGPWKDPASQGFPKIPKFPDAALLPDVGGMHAGWVLMLALTGLVFLFMNFTKKGYEIAVVGESLDTARYAGMNIPAIIMTAMFISGGLCGLVGFVQASAIEKTLTWGLSSNYGFTAIITTWLARLNAVTTLFVCLAFAVLLQGADYIQLALHVPAAVAQVVQGIILFFVLGSDFFLRYRVKWIGLARARKEAVQ
ncbi:MAG: ABC transporter permease [Clostridiales Family XIII bacterium]|jgi:simple sugar transport system permease protein|nr:ABC transporter permease [Clostridiales Family XIII bacterium]